MHKFAWFWGYLMCQIQIWSVSWNSFTKSVVECGGRGEYWGDVDISGARDVISMTRYETKLFFNDDPPVSTSILTSHNTSPLSWIMNFRTLNMMVIIVANEKLFNRYIITLPNLTLANKKSFATGMSVIFVISTSNYVRINKNYAWYRWRTCP